MFDKQIYVSRRERLRSKVNSGIILILGNVDAPMNYLDNTYHFRQDSSFLYFFGLDQQRLAGVIDVDAGEDYLLGDDVDIEDIIWMGPQVGLAERAAKVGVEKTDAFAKLFDMVDAAIKQGRKVHFLPPYRAENKLLLEQLTGVHPSKQRDYVSMELVHAVIALRSIKEPCEIVEIEKACRTGYQMHVTAMKMAQPGVWEQKIAGTIEGISLAGGGMASFPIILSQNGETLHNHDHSNILEEGKLMLTDAGAETTMRYASDFTRTVPVGGEIHPEAERNL